jgi:hypothetical protein
MLENNGSVTDISKFFSFLEGKMKRISAGEEEFSAFVSSIFEALMKQTSESCLRACLLFAEELITLNVNPCNADMICVEGEDHRQFCRRVDSYEGQSDIERYCFFRDTVNGNLWEIPIYQYQGVGCLLLSLCECDEENILDPLFDCLSFLQHLPFGVKICFLKPIALKLLYLHQVFSLAAPKVDSFTKKPDDLRKLLEEWNLDIGHLSEVVVGKPLRKGERR